MTTGTMPPEGETPVARKEGEEVVEVSMEVENHEAVVPPPPVSGEDVANGAVANEEATPPGEPAEGEDAKKDTRRHMVVAADAPWGARMWEVFTTFWPLGLIAFGGPQAHVAILRDHLVEQRDWLDEESFTELFAIGQVSNA